MNNTRWTRVGFILLFALLFAALGWWWLAPRSRTVDLAQFASPKGKGAAANNDATSLRKPADIHLKAREARRKIDTGERQPGTARQRASEAILGKFAALGGRDGVEAPPLRGAGRGYGKKVLNPAQQQAIDDLLARVGAGAELQMDQTDGTLRYLRADLQRLVESSADFQTARADKNFEAMATSTVAVLSRAMNIVNPSEEFKARASDRDELGMVHVKLDQTYQGIPIYGAQVVVHFDAQGNPVQVQGVYTPTPSGTTVPAREIDAQTALGKAREAASAGNTDLQPPILSRVYYWNPTVSPILTYQVDLVPSMATAYRVFISVADGSVVHVARRVFSAAASGQAKDLLGVAQPANSWQDGNTFLAIDTTLPMYDTAKSTPPTFTNVLGGICLFDVAGQDVEEALKKNINYIQSNSKDQWDPTAMSMMSHFRRAFTYFKNQHNRNSWDDQGMTLTGLIHAKFKNPDGQLYTDNAFFNPGMNVIVAGEGEKICAPGMLPAALDVIAHEYSHGVVDHSASFQYENQSGALHEHMADYFGTLVEGKINWVLGEDAMQGTGKAGWRDLSDPHNSQVTSPGPKTMAEYENLPNTPQGDLGGVHVNSTIPSYAAYLLTDGPQGLGAEKAGKIIYRALTKYMTQNSDFLDYRRSALSATRDLYPEATNIVRQAFDAAQILEAETAPPPPPAAPTTGDDYTLFLRAEVDPFFGTFMGYGLYQLSAQDVRLVASQYVGLVRPAVSGNGKWALYVGQDNNIYWTDGNQEEAWTDSGDIRTIALSKDLRYIAFTTTDYDDIITIIDTTTQEIRTAPLRIPTSGDPVTLSYADVLTFNCLNDTLFFDAWSQGRLAQTEYGSWVLCSLRLKDLACQTVLPFSPGLQMGNPSMANTQPYSLLADYIYTADNQETVGSVYLDLNQGQLSVLLKGLNTYAAATFRGDDAKIVFQSYDHNSSMYYLNEAALTADRSALNASSLIQLLWSVNSLAYPVGFRSGAYTPPAPQIAVNPGTVDFGPVAVGMAATNSLVITNAGNADLELIEVSLENGDLDAFDFASVVQKRVPAGRGQTLSLAFHPAKSGALTASLRVKSTVPGQADTVVRLQGQGNVTTLPSLAYWRQVWQDFQDNYSYFDYKGVNWSTVYDQHTNEFTQVTPDQFAEKLNGVLQTLHDWHVTVQKPDGTYLGYNGAYPKNYSDSFFSGYSGGAPYTNLNGGNVIWHTTLTNKMAYVYVDSFSTDRWNKITDQTLEDLFARIAGAPGLILDFRGNNGGDEGNAIKLASRFIDQAVTYGYVRYRVTNSVPYRFDDYLAKVLQPSTGTRFAKPLVGLVGQRNLSSAEWFALMLKNSPNSVLMGDRTRGASGNPLTKTIPALNISYAISRWMAYTEHKLPFEDRGIEPALKLAPESSYDDNLKRDYVLEKAMAYLQWRVDAGSKLAVSSGLTDKDGDGVLDVVEYLSGTDPSDAQSRFGFSASGIKVKADGSVTLQWGSVAGRQYNILRASDVPGIFTAIGKNLPATPPLNSYTDTTAGGKGPYFYKLELNP